MLKEKIISWYIRNFIEPKIWIINNPSFIITKFGKYPYDVFGRELFFPEEIFSEFEKRIVEEYRKKGEQILYSIGKKFGYVFSSKSKFPNLKTVTKEEFLKFSKLFLTFLSSTWAEKVDFDINWNQKLLHLKFKNFVVCSRNGIGRILPEGAGAGMWAYALSDNSVEALKTKCQGRKDGECEIICASRDILSKMKIKFLTEKNVNKIYKDDEYLYRLFNKIRVTKYSKNSIKNLIDSGFLLWEKRIIRFENQRFFPCEISLMYILENELKKLKNANNVLFDVAFEYGKKLGQRKNAEKFITDFLGALGWGDILVLKEKEKYKIIVNYFPWTGFAEKIDFALFRGMISGILSKKKNIKLKLVKKDLSSGYFSLMLKDG